jgi:hypothetical protein
MRIWNNEYNKTGLKGRGAVDSILVAREYQNSSPKSNKTSQCISTPNTSLSYSTSRAKILKRKEKE